MPTAIVTGATGILGREIVKELGKSPDQWTQVHALSRSKKEDCPNNTVHNFIDLQASTEEMTKQLKDVDGDYIFFAAYLAQDTEEAATKVNGDMLQTFLQAIENTGAVKKVKRIILVTGAKQYGVHLGVPKNPMQESDPWLGDEFPPNFYYRQQRILHAFTEKHSHISWVVTYPNDVIGFAKGNFMNLTTSAALYAAVNKELGNQYLEWPGSRLFYTRFDSFTSSKLHAQFCAWAALEPKAANQAFNVVNGDAESWQNLFPRLAATFGLQVKPDTLSGEPGPDSGTFDLHKVPPISTQQAKLGLEGIDLPKQLDSRVDLAKWSQKKEVVDAWKRLAEREGLQQDAFEKATWGFLGFVLSRPYDIVISMSKARKLGWTGYQDTWEAFEDVFEDLRKDKILPA